MPFAPRENAVTEGSTMSARTWWCGAMFAAAAAGARGDCPEESAGDEPPWYVQLTGVCESVDVRFLLEDMFAKIRKFGRRAA